MVFLTTRIFFISVGSSWWLAWGRRCIKPPMPQPRWDAIWFISCGLQPKLWIFSILVQFLFAYFPCWLLSGHFEENNSMVAVVLTHNVPGRQFGQEVRRTSETASIILNEVVLHIVPRWLPSPSGGFRDCHRSWEWICGSGVVVSTSTVVISDKSPECCEQLILEKFTNLERASLILPWSGRIETIHL